MAVTMNRDCMNAWGCRNKIESKNETHKVAFYKTILRAISARQLVTYIILQFLMQENN